MSRFHIVVVTALITAALVGGTTYAVTRQQFIANDTAPALRTQLSDTVRALTPLGGFDTDTTGWKTYANNQLGYSFKYPSDWTLLQTDSDNYFNEQLLPTRYYTTWKDQPHTKDGTVPNTAVGCAVKGDSTSPAPSAPNDVAIHDYQLGSDGPKGTYYVETILWNLQWVRLEHGNVICMLEQPANESSPWTKEEDVTGWEILNTFRFTK